METDREIICIVCPRGCRIHAALEEGAVKDLSGFGCKRGETYARAECIAPTRTLTTTMRVTGGMLPLLPVRSQTPVPKERLFDFIQAVNAAHVCAPVHIGEVVLENVLGTGINLIASRDLLRKQPETR